jgi:hypothetical protein
MPARRRLHADARSRPNTRAARETRRMARCGHGSPSHEPANEGIDRDTAEHSVTSPSDVPGRDVGSRRTKCRIAACRILQSFVSSPRFGISRPRRDRRESESPSRLSPAVNRSRLRNRVSGEPTPIPTVLGTARTRLYFRRNVEVPGLGLFTNRGSCIRNVWLPRRNSSRNRRAQQDQRGQLGRGLQVSENHST